MPCVFISSLHGSCLYELLYQYGHFTWIRNLRDCSNQPFDSLHFSDGLKKTKWNIENPFWKTFTVCSLLQEIPFVFSRLWVKWQGQTVWCLFYFKCVNSLLVLSQQNFWGTIHALLDCDHVKTETLASWCGFKWTRVCTLTKPGFWDFTVWIRKILQII